MRKTCAVGRRLSGFGLATVSALAMVIVGASPAAAEGAIIGAGNPHAVKDSYIIELNGSAVRARGVQFLSTALAGRHGATVRHTYEHALQGFSVTMSEAAARRLAADPAVARVQQNATVSVADTQFHPPYNLDRIDQRLRNYNYSYTYPNAGAGVRAYVIDTGVRVSHVEFGGRATWGANTVGDGINDDCNGHGTHVAGTLGGAAFGVAKGVSLTAVKVLGCNGHGTAAAAIAGVDWVTAHHISGPAVANMSLGFPTAIPLLEQAVRNSIADGVVYTIASGNSNADACSVSPARTLEAITVNASDGNDIRAPFSNFGSCTDIFAPGVSITAAGRASDTATEVRDGTSMAAPHVAGAAALMLAANPALNAAQVAAGLATNATQGLVADPRPGTPNRLLFVNHHAPPAPATGADRMIRGQYLLPNQFLRSQNNLYTLYMQGDGNLVLYGPANQVLWQTYTSGYAGSYAAFQPDGNWVLYRGDGVPFHTVTNGTATNLFVLQNDSNLVLYGPAGQVYWQRSQGLRR